MRRADPSGIRLGTVVRKPDGTEGTVTWIDWAARLARCTDGSVPSRLGGSIPFDSLVVVRQTLCGDRDCPHRIDARLPCSGR